MESFGQGRLHNIKMRCLLLYTQAHRKLKGRREYLLHQYEKFAWVDLNSAQQADLNGRRFNMAHAKNFQDLTGQKMHRLTFLSFVGRNEQRNARWKVRCDCGTIFEVTASSVKVGQTKSCVCLRIENNKNRHKHYFF